jgi:hypothetical protein
MNEKFKIIPSKKRKMSSHYSSMMRKVKKVNELSLLFYSLEKCTINLYGFIRAMWKLAKLVIKIIWWLLFILLSILSAL